MLDEGSELQGAFKELDPDIASAMKEGLKKYKKYYTFMDESAFYYTALVLDPRVKGDLIKRELEDKEASDLILTAIRNNLHLKYPPPSSELPRSSTSHQQTPDVKRSTVESRMLQRLQPLESLPFVSDIDRYFDTPRVTITDTSDPKWLLNWSRLHKDEFPQMAAAARGDYLGVPASEVAVERLFNIGRDLLGIRRHSMNGDTLRVLMLLNNNNRE